MENSVFIAVRSYIYDVLCQRKDDGYVIGQFFKDEPIEIIGMFHTDSSDDSPTLLHMTRQ